MKRDNITYAYNLKRDIENLRSALRNALELVEKLPGEIESKEATLRNLGVTD